METQAMHRSRDPKEVPGFAYDLGSKRAPGPPLWSGALIPMGGVGFLGASSGTEGIHRTRPPRESLGRPEEFRGNPKEAHLGWSPFWG